MSTTTTNNQTRTVQVSFRLPIELAERLKDASNGRVWPPPPSQTEIVIRGVEHVLRTLEKRSKRA